MELVSDGQAETLPHYREVLVVREARTQDLDGRPFVRRHVEVADESDEDPLLRADYWQRTDAHESLLSEHPDWEATARQADGALAIGTENVPARQLYLDESGRPTQMTAWGAQMKEAIALEGLQRLERGGRFLPGGRLDARTAELFRYMSDGIGLRSRQRVYRDLLVSRASAAEADTLRIASLGSGAAVPNIEATLAVEAQGGRIEWRMFDLDPRALQAAAELIAEAPIRRSTFDLGPAAAEAGVAGFAGRSYLEIRHAVPDGSLDAVDALGLWEYLSHRQAVTFLRVCLRKLKPGAPMIVSNMLKTRPHLLYNQRAVGWPDLHLRGEEELLSVAQDAGVDTSRVRITHAADGVYAVVDITA
ncbi:hypothetical protein [Microbacterium rhizophilus]|uniref:hypothetical protein n=1 Tax=Microbacterium rhizophilus TaxID=3138934 RepID=UPI0031EE3C99